MYFDTFNEVILYVEDPIQSAEFYTRVFDILPVHTSPTFVVFLLQNGIKFALSSRHAVVPACHVLPGASEINIAVDDVDAVYAELAKKNIKVALAPVDLDFGRTFVMLDPDGHRIRFAKMHEQKK